MREQFFDKLYKKLNFLTSIEIKKQLDKYSNFIDEAIKNGATEKSAIKSLGSIDNVIKDIKMEYDLLDTKYDEIKEQRVTKEKYDNINDEENGSTKQLFKILVMVIIITLSIFFCSIIGYLLWFLTITFTFIDYQTIMLLIGLILIFVALLLTSTFSVYHLFYFLYKSKKPIFKKELIVNSSILSLGIFIIFVSFCTVKFDTNNFFNYGKYKSEIIYFSLEDDVNFIDCTNITFNIIEGDYQDPYVVIYSNKQVSFEVNKNNNVNIKQNGTIPNYYNFPKMKIEVYYHEGITSESTFTFESKDVNVIFDSYYDIKNINVEAINSTVVMVSSIMTNDININSYNSDLSLYESIVENVNIESDFSNIYVRNTIPNSFNVTAKQNYYDFKDVILNDNFILKANNAIVLLKGVSSNSKATFDINTLNIIFENTMIDNILINSNDAHIDIINSMAFGLFELNCIKLNLFTENSILNDIKINSQDSIIHISKLMHFDESSLIEIVSINLHLRLFDSTISNLQVNAIEGDVYFTNTEIFNTTLNVDSGIIIAELVFGIESYEFNIITQGESNVNTGGNGLYKLTIKAKYTDITLM